MKTAAATEGGTLVLDRVPFFIYSENKFGNVKINSYLCIKKLIDIMRTKIYLYAGYYEMFITDRPLDKPYTLISWHYSVDAAEKRALKEHPDDKYYFKVNLFPDDYHYVLEDFIDRGEPIPVSTIQGDEFYIF